MPKINHEKLRQIAETNGFGVDIANEGKKLTFTPPKEKTLSHDPEFSKALNALGAVVAQNSHILGEILRLDMAEGSAMQQPKSWHCSIKRADDGTIDSFTLTQLSDQSKGRLRAN